AGIVAAAGIQALHHVKCIQEDNEKALLLGNFIKIDESLFCLNNIQSNIVILDLSPSGLVAQDVAEDLAERGLKVRAISKNQLRMVVYKDITECDIRQAAHVINRYFATVST